MAVATTSSGTEESNAVVLSKPATKHILRAALVGTTSHAASSHMPCENYKSVGIVVTYAGVDHTSIELLFQGSRDATAWIDIPVRGATTIAEHANTLANNSSATDAAFLVPLDVDTMLYVRVWVKYTGGTAAGTIAIDGYAGCGV